jgi:hypothetical protein
MHKMTDKIRDKSQLTSLTLGALNSFKPIQSLLRSPEVAVTGSFAMELVQAVLYQSPISFDDLIERTSDVDFTGDAPVRSLIEQQPLKFVWDFIETKHYNASLQGGGCGLDKLKISSIGIEDPFGALDCLIESRLNYRFVDDDAFNVYGSFFLQPSRMAKAIIFYGIEQSFGEARNRDALMQILAVEANRECKLTPKNVWLDKAMKKCEKRVQNCPTDLLIDFIVSGILEKIVSNGVSLTSEIARKIDFDRLARSISAKDVPIIERFLASVDDVIRFKEGMLAASEGSVMTAALLGLNEYSPSVDYKMKVQDFRRKHEGLIRSRLQHDNLRDLIAVYYH